MLAVLAGTFISLGALFFTVVATNSTLGFGMTRLVGGHSVTDKILGGTLLVAGVYWLEYLKGGKKTVRSSKYSEMV